MKETTKLSVGPGGQLNKSTSVEPEVIQKVKRVNFTPFPGTVLVKQLSKNQFKTESGIVMFEQDNKGVIVAVGPDVSFFKPGDVVLINLGHGNILQHWIDNQLLAPVYPSSLIGKYDNLHIPLEDADVPNQTQLGL